LVVKVNDITALQILVDVIRVQFRFHFFSAFLVFGFRSGSSLNISDTIFCNNSLSSIIVTASISFAPSYGGQRHYIIAIINSGSLWQHSQ
ncbi:MAG: hypothetical protein II936_10835, partial [Oscillospiraceae bacterium]|nr:hypothetical protein [Oscillospiraceae bacterium]